jgi:hypothetical protein
MRIQSVYLGGFSDGFKARERTPDASHAMPDEHAGRGGSRLEHVRYEHGQNSRGGHILRIAQYDEGVFALAQVRPSATLRHNGRPSFISGTEGAGTLSDFDSFRAVAFSFWTPASARRRCRSDLRSRTDFIVPLVGSFLRRELT